MKFLDAQAVAMALPYEPLIDALDDAFQSELVVPERAHYDIEVPETATGSLLTMPAWRCGAHIGVKVVTIFPGNSSAGLRPVNATYLLLDANTGVPIAQLDGAELTLRRTAAASGLASRYLSRADCRVMLMVGSGSLAPHLISAHAGARPIREVLVWGRRTETAQDLASGFAGAAFDVTVVDDLQSAVRSADLISCATLATEPLVLGEWLKEGQHLDLVGAFRPGMQEADTAALLRADIYVDTYAGALSESGEIVAAIEKGAMTERDIVAELAELTRGTVAGRRADDSITIFKSVGTALEDLTGAELAIRNYDAHE